MPPLGEARPPKASLQEQGQAEPTQEWQALDPDCGRVQDEEEGTEEEEQESGSEVPLPSATYSLMEWPTHL